jgi:DNA sulfur modification protein DndD
MTFLELVIENVGAFKGRHVIDMLPKEGRSIILIGALNGSGKTTLLNAFQLALYGKESRGIRGGQNYHTYLRQLINADAASSDAASLELTLDLSQETGRGCIRVQRRWWRNERNETREQLTVFEKDVRDEQLTQSWDTFISAILPPRLADLFFFDGEKIEGLTESDRAADIIKRGLYVLLGLERIDELRRNLRTLKRRRAGMIEGDKAQSTFTSIEERLNSLKAARGPLLQTKASTQNAFDLSARAFREAEAAFREGGGEVFQSRQTWSKREADIGAELLSLSDQLRHAASKELPLLLVPHLLDEAYKLSKSSEEAATATIVAKAIDERDKQYIRILQDLGITRAMAKQITEELQSLRPKKRNDIPSNTLGVRSERVARYMPTHRDEIRAQALKLLSETASKQKQLASVRIALEGIPAEAQIADLSSAMQQAQTEHATTAIRLSMIDDELNKLEGQISATQSELDSAIQDAASKENANNDSRRVIRHITLAEETLANYLKEIVKQRSADIAARILKSFREIARKPELIANLSIDPDSFQLSIFNKRGLPVLPDELSAGERQILAFATLNGLAKTAGKKVPTLIDSPLGRLDGVHRDKIATHYFPTAAHQTIIFSTDKEVDNEMWKVLQPSVAHSYLLNFDEDNNASTISNGYFAAR